jgi:hypothetical protein
MMINDARGTREIKTSIAAAKAAFNKKKILFTRKFDLNLRKKLADCYVWGIVLCGAETWPLRRQYLRCGAGEEWPGRVKKKYYIE